MSGRRLLPAVVVAAGLAFGAMAEGVPFAIKDGTNTISVTAVAGECARVSPMGGGVALEVVAPKPDKWPAVYFRFGGFRNLDGVGEIHARVRNLLTNEVQKIGLKVKAETQQGQTPGTMAGVRPGAGAVIRLPLKIECYVFDKDPKLKGLKRHPKVVGGSSYTLDKAYAISLFLPPMSEGGRFAVEAIEFVPAAGGAQAHVLKADELNPWVDEFGQAKFAAFPAKIRSAADFGKQHAAEMAELAAKPEAIPEADEYGGWKGGPRLKATGHFRTEKVDGKWWLVDPAGRLYFAQGMNCGWDLTPTAVQYREEYFEKLPPREGETAPFWTQVKKVAYRNYYSDPARVPYWAFSFQRHNLWRKYGGDYLAKNRETMAKRCKAWGINCLTGAPKELRAATKIPYHVSLSPQSRKIASAKGYWGEMLDPYAPEFASNCLAQAQWLKESRDDPYCIGCTVHNELSWGRDGAALAKSVMAAPDGQPAKVALAELLARRGKTAETAGADDWRALGQAFAEKYYSTVRRAVKTVAPEMLYLGDRNDKRNPETFKAAAKHCDVLTVNVYDYQASVELPAGAEDKPLWVTEFHFGCYDTGYFYASLMPVATQAKRAQCYRDYLASAVDSPSYVGANWFCWRDQPITGVIGESANSSCGVVSVTDVPYRELTEAMKSVAGEMYGRRYGARRGRTAEICYGGILDVAELGFRLVPSQRIGEADNFRDGGAAMTVAAKGETLDGRWAFPAAEGVTVDQLGLELDVAAFAGGKAMVCGSEVALPAAFAGTVHLIVGEGREFSFASANGGEVLRLRFAEPIRLHAMDARAWNMSHFVFRFERKVAAGEGAEIAFAAETPGVGLAVRERPPYVIAAGREWIPIVDATNVVAGSALDFSAVVPAPAPIGEADRIVVRDGHFEAAGRPGRRIRFYGCNVTGGANFLNARTARAFVAKLRRLGYNALRLHHHDEGLSKDFGAADALVAACAEQGLYLTSDLFASRRVAYRDCGIDRDGLVGMDEYKRLVLEHEGAYSNYLAFARAWLTHVNPATGRRVADEPALALLAFVNEGHLEPRDAAAAQRDAALEMRFAERTAAFLRDEIGTKALLSDMSAGMEREEFRKVRESAAYDYVDEHFYCDHPTFPEAAWRLPLRVRGDNPVRSRSGYPQLNRLAEVRVRGKPFVMTEWDFTGCYAGRSAAGLIGGGVAAAGGWDGLWRFNFADSPWEAMHPEQCGIGVFSISGNPLTQASERAGMCLFARGDLADAAQMRVDATNGAFAVDTPRTAGGFASDGRIRAGALTAEAEPRPVSAWASALDGQTLADAHRILLTHLTDVQNSGQTYADPTRTILREWGGVPHLMRAGKARIALACGEGPFEVWALGADGARRRRVPHEQTGGGIRVEVDVAADPKSATWLYEIVRNPQAQAPDLYRTTGL